MRASAFVGRVGGLAIALGIGAAAVSGGGVASAATGDDQSSNNVGAGRASGSGADPRSDTARGGRGTADGRGAGRVDAEEPRTRPAQRNRQNKVRGSMDGPSVTGVAPRAELPQALPETVEMQSVVPPPASRVMPAPSAATTVSGPFSSSPVIRSVRNSAAPVMAARASRPAPATGVLESVTAPEVPSGPLAPAGAALSMAMLAGARRETASPLSATATVAPAAAETVGGAADAALPLLDGVSDLLTSDFGEPYVYVGLTNFKWQYGPALILLNTDSNAKDDTSWQYPKGLDKERQFELTGTQKIETSPDGTTVFVTTIYKGRPAVVVANAEYLGLDIAKQVGSSTPLKKLDITAVVPLAPEGSGRELEQTNGMAVSPDGKRVYVSGRDGYIKVVEDSTLLGQLTPDPSAGWQGVPGWGFSDRPGPLVVSPDGKRLYVASGTGVVSVFDTENLGTPVTNPSGITTWQATPIKTAIIDGGIAGEEHYRASTPMDIAITPDGNTLYVAFAGGYTSRYDDLSGTWAFATDTMKVLGEKAPGGSGALVPQPVSKAYGALAVSPDGARLYITNDRFRPGGITVVDTARSREIGSALNTSSADGWSANDVVLSPDGRSAWVRTGVVRGYMGYAAVERFDPFTMKFSAPRFEWVTAGGDDGLAVGTGSSLVGSGLIPDGTDCGCNRAPVKGSGTGYVAGSLSVDANGVVRGQVSATDPDDGDTLKFKGYHIGDAGGDDVVVDLLDGSSRFTTAKGGVVTVQSSGEFTYQPSAEAQATAAKAGAVARDKFDTFGVSVYDRERETAGGLAVVPVTVPISPAAPTVTLTGPAAPINEGSAGKPGKATFTVALANGAKAGANGVVVDYQLSQSGTNPAWADDDYVVPSARVTIPKDANSAQFSVTFVGDGVVEPDETFAVTMVSATGATLGAAKAATVTIKNDDIAAPPVVSLVGPAAPVVEGNSGVSKATFTVALANGAKAASDVTVKYSAAGSGSARATSGTDFTAPLGSVKILKGANSATFSVDVRGDTTVESDEAFTVTLTSATGATLGAAKAATVTIRNDDVSPVVSLSPGSVNVVEGNSGVSKATFTVALANGATAASDMTVKYATSSPTSGNRATAGTDYTAVSSGSVKILKGTNSATFAVDVRGDKTIEADEMFLVRLTGATGAALGTVKTATVTIRNDDGVISAL